MQINFIIYFADSAFKANIIDSVSIKCKQIIQSVLIAKLYKITLSFDIEYLIKAILGKILQAKILLIFSIKSSL